ncbi:MAG: hypothetical protein ACYDDF_08395 [Thermoplasmatota archaeon]
MADGNGNGAPRTSAPAPPPATAKSGPGGSAAGASNAAKDAERAALRQRRAMLRRNRNIRGFVLLARVGFAIAILSGAALSWYVASQSDAASAGGLPWWLGSPAWLAYVAGAAAFVLFFIASARLDSRWEIAAYGALAVAFGRVMDGVPDLSSWAMAVAGAAGVLLAVESLSTGRRLSKLLLAEQGEAHLERVAGALRGATLLPLAGAIIVIGLSLPFGRFLLGIASPGLGASLEAQGLFGAALGALLMAGVVGFAAWARHVRERAT